MSQTPQFPVGRSGILNPLKGVALIPISSDSEIGTLTNIVAGTPVFNSDTRELKIAIGPSLPNNLVDHRHPYTHAPLIHDHFFGMNEAWLMGNAKLWYAPDVENHPELIVLDGREITDDEAEYISNIYNGSFFITTNENMSLTSNGFENDIIIASTSTWKGTHILSNLFGDPLNNSNLILATDQWLTTSTDLTSEQTVTITFKNNKQYRITDYLLMPANGTSTALAATRPTPKSWVLEAEIDGTWTAIDTHTNEDASTWSVFTVRQFTLNTVPAAATAVRLRITAWNAGDDASMELGLRRFWLFGRQPNAFHLPKIESPSDDFVWVIPRGDMNVGFKNEEIGDIGVTAVMSEQMRLYRVPADGSRLAIADYEELFAKIGYQNSPKITGTETASIGTITNSVWNLGATDSLTIGYMSLDQEDAAMLGYVHVEATGRYPKEAIIEAENVDGSFDTIGSWSNIQEEAYTLDTGVYSRDFVIATNVTAKDYQSFRINVTEWSEGSTNLSMKVEFHAQSAGYFYLPTYTTNQSGVTTYIVARNVARDVSSDIIQRLQQNVIALTNTVATLTARINELDPETDTSAGE